MPKKPYVRLPRYSIHDIFTDDEIEDLVKIARDRVLRAFDQATEVVRGQERGTDNYILCGPKHGDLVSSILQRDMKAIVSLKFTPMPLHLRRLSEKQSEKLVNQLHTRLLHMAVHSLHQGHHIWYDERGLWNVCQSTMDDWRRTRKHIRRAIKAGERGLPARPHSLQGRRSVTYASKAS